MDKGGFVFATYLSNFATTVEVIGTFDYLDSGVFIHKGNVCPPLFIFGWVTRKFGFGIWVLPLGSHVVAEHKPAEEGAYEGGSYLNSVHRSNSTNTTDSSNVGVFGKGFNLIRHNESVFKENTGKVKKLFSLFLGSLRPMDTFVSQRPYAMCPLSHGFGNHALLNQLVYGVNKPDVLLSKHLLNGKFKSCSATRDDKVIVLLCSFEGFLCLCKSFVYPFGYSYVREDLRRRWNYFVNRGWDKFTGTGIIPHLVRIEGGTNAYNRFVTFGIRTLGKDGYLNITAKLIGKNTDSHGHYGDAYENDLFKTIGTNALKSKQLGRYFTWN